MSLSSGRIQGWPSHLPSNGEGMDTDAKMAHAQGIGPGFTLEAAAVRLIADIGELRDDGGIPPHVRTVITVVPQQRVLEIRVEGLSVEADPDRTTAREQRRPPVLRYGGSGRRRRGNRYTAATAPAGRVAP